MHRQRIVMLVSFVVLLLTATLLTTATVAAAPPAGNATHIIVFNEGVDVDVAVPDMAAAYGLKVQWPLARRPSAVA